ncbi:cell cycle checkpoint control protein RAD9A-like, partial [Heterodontus francisci]|uniref:cell cycle checkpoint control protein RAD9A-like n=1 Tax=Heterodontus francisci TaxID=7792 RepID=UPI00355AFD05
SLLAVFKSPASMEKTVERCKMVLGRGRDQLVIQLLCKYGITKTHNLSFQDCETLQAVYTKDTCPNTLRAQPKLLTDTVIHFPTNLEEVTLDVKARRVTLKNYIEPDSDPRKMMLTEMVLTPAEFDEFCVKEESEITFCLKELRGLLGFAEASGLPLTVHFEGPGSPAIFSLQDAVLDVTFVLATLSDSHSQRSQQTAGSEGSLAAALGRPGLDDDFMSEEIDSYMIAMETSAMEEMLTVANEGPADEGCPPRSPTFPLAHLCKRPHGGGATTELAEEEEDSEIPATPPHKK